MTTLAAMITEIEDDMERSDTSAIRGKVLAAIRHFQSTRFYFNETRGVTFATVSGTQDYAISDVGAEFYHIDGLYVTFGTSIIASTPVDYREIEALRDASASTNVPTRFAYIKGSLALYPVPNDAYSVRVTGHHKVDAPATDGEANNVWMTEAYDLIKARAKAKLFAERYRDAEGATIEKVLEADALSELQAQTASKVGTGAFRPTQF